MSPPKKYYWTTEQDELLLRNYNHHPRVIDEIQRQLPNYPRWEIKRRARILGLARTAEPEWTAKEAYLLEQWLPRYQLQTIANKLGRTVTAISLKARRLGIVKTKIGYPLEGAAGGLGCDPHKIKAWIQSGKLRAIKRQTKHVPDIWLIDPVDLRDFVKKNPNDVSFRTADKRFLITVLH